LNTSKNNNQNLTSLIQHNPDNIDISEMLVYNSVTNQGYIWPIDGLELTNKEYEQFKQELDKLSKYKEYDFSDNNRQVFKNVQSDDYFIFVQGDSKNVFLSFLTKSLDISNKIFKLYRKYYKEDTEVKAFLTTYFYQNSVQSNTKRIEQKEIDNNSNLYYPYINTDLMFNQFFSLKENILILNGKPGIGKSKFFVTMLKYAVHNQNEIPYDKIKENINLQAQFVTIAYVKSTDVLADDGFWKELSTKEYDFVVLDDLDYMLTKRNAETRTAEDQNRTKFINQFLSYTDGIENNKTKFVITTNQSSKDIDLALLRKGRLFDMLELRDLTREESLRIWLEQNLDEYDFLQVFGKFKRILPADLGSTIEKYINKETVEIKEYLLEPGISKVQKMQTTNKVGF